MVLHPPVTKSLLDLGGASRYTPFVRPAVLLAAVSFWACSDKGAPIEPPLGSGKDDIADRVDLSGALALGGEARGELTEDLEFHGTTTTPAGAGCRA
jgi:hypothetical protein